MYFTILCVCIFFLWFPQKNENEIRTTLKIDWAEKLRTSKQHFLKKDMYKESLSYY